jgi:hypothetical protein
VYYREILTVVVTELDTITADSIQGTYTESQSPRSTGTLHLSTIYRDLEQTALKQREPDMTEEELAWYAAGGYIWEHVFSAAFARSVYLVRTDEWELDGIVGSPDSMDIDNWRVIELKCRWMSSRKFDQLEKYFWTELLQIRGYCKMTGATEAELWVFFVNGDYRPPRPQVRGVLLEFSGRELDEAWACITNHARLRGWL